MTTTSPSSLAEALSETSIPSVGIIQPQVTPSADLSWMPIVILMLWSGCLVIGILGMTMPYDRPRAPARPPEPLQAIVLNVELTHDPRPPDSATPMSSQMAPPPLAVAPPPPAAIPMTTVTEPDQAVAFDLPIERPGRVAELFQPGTASSEGLANQATAVVWNGPAGGTAESLTYGQGNGRQPAPEYPRQARQAGQQGAVGVRFSVGADGRVLDAEAADPSPWPLLNAAAVRVVRERWRFPPGPPRLYFVSIRFQLQN